MPTIRDHDEPQTLGDVLARMKPLPTPPPGAPDDAYAQTQTHNEALAKLQTSARVARALAENAVTHGGPFPESLLTLVPGRLVGPLAAARIHGQNMSKYANPRRSEGQPSEKGRDQDPMGPHAAQIIQDTRPHTSKTQQELELLRKSHPELGAAEARLDEESKPQGWWDSLWGIGRESGLLAYSNTSDPSAPLIIKPQHSVKGKSGYYDVTPSPPSGVYPEIPGYKLEMFEHNHPFPEWSFWPGAHNPLPSNVDQDIAEKNPSAFGVLRRGVIKLIRISIMDGGRATDDEAIRETYANYDSCSSPGDSPFILHGCVLRSGFVPRADRRLFWPRGAQSRSRHHYCACRVAFKAPGTGERKRSGLAQRLQG